MTAARARYRSDGRKWFRMVLGSRASTAGRGVRKTSGRGGGFIPPQQHSDDVQLGTREAAPLVLCAQCFYSVLLFPGRAASAHAGTNPLPEQPLATGNLGINWARQHL